MRQQGRHLSPWWQMISGMRAYGAAITIIWAMCACTVLAVAAVAVGGTWQHVGFGVGAVLELLLSAGPLRRLARRGATTRRRRRDARPG
jgi:hypothetical protein